MSSLSPDEVKRELARLTELRRELRPEVFDVLVELLGWMLSRPRRHRC